MNQLSFFDLIDGYENLKTKTSNDWLWTLKDYPEKNGHKVFSCFACGGGSTMGYKLAGYEVLGCVEIDKKMNSIYVKNYNPKYNYLMDLREFNKIPNSELPTDLFNLDILDGSPPCTTFSMAGKREETWGKLKKFKEGQTEQTLDDLPFVFIETVNKLKPKFVVMENVEGIIKGNAWKYVQDIYKSFHSIGYRVKHYLLNGEKMGVPQRRHRVFFIATRLQHIDLNKVDMAFNYAEIPFKSVKSVDVEKVIDSPTIYALVQNARYGDRSLEDASKRLRGKGSFFNYTFAYDDKPCPTLTGHENIIRWDKKSYLSKKDIISVSTFPQDYDFVFDSKEHITYTCGMSVPPVMIKRIAERLNDYL